MIGLRKNKNHPAVRGLGFWLILILLYMYVLNLFLQPVDPTCSRSLISRAQAGDQERSRTQFLAFSPCLMTVWIEDRAVVVVMRLRPNHERSMHVSHVEWRLNKRSYVGWGSSGEVWRITEYHSLGLGCAKDDLVRAPTGAYLIGLGGIYALIGFMEAI